MTEGWGEDFDEDGNVIGEMPESDTEPNFVEKHWKAVVIASLIVFAINLPRLSSSIGSIGGLIGGLLASPIVGIPLAYVCVKLRQLI